MKFKKTLLFSSIIGIFGCLNYSTIVHPVHAVTDDVDLNVSIVPAIYITIPTNTVTLNLTPTNTASFKNTDLSVTVGTNNPTGYTLTMAPSDSTSTSLTRTGGTEIIPTLATLAGGYTEQTFTTNRWGYKLSSTNYLPFATSNEITTTNAPTASNTSTVTFAAKGDTTLASGAYELEITFTATANVVPLTWDQAFDSAGKTKDGNYYLMQDANSTICQNVASGATTTVKDTRDGELYVIGKLADGKCWMLDNLRLDVLSIDLNTLKGNTNATDESLTYLKNGGGSSPYATTAVNSTWSGPSGNVYNEPKAISTYKDTLATTYYGVGSGKIGMYYNYCAISAGSYCYGSSEAVGNATQDVCPSGWRLPTAGTGGELPNLYDAYGNATDFDNAFSATVSYRYDWGSQSTQKGMWPSSTLRTDSVAYMMSLSIQSDYVTKYDYAMREMGFTVRCILK